MANFFSHMKRCADILFRMLFPRSVSDVVLASYDPNCDFFNFTQDGPKKRVRKRHSCWKTFIGYLLFLSHSWASCLPISCIPIKFLIIVFLICLSRTSLAYTLMYNLCKVFLKVTNKRKDFLCILTSLVPVHSCGFSCRNVDAMFGSHGTIFFLSFPPSAWNIFFSRFTY